MSGLSRTSYGGASGDRRPDLGYSSVPPGGSLGRVSGTSTPGLGRVSQQPNFQRNSVSKAQTELARRSEYPTQMNVQLMIQEADSGEAVYYKSDGGRFQHSQETLKFREGEVYKVTIMLKPESKVVENIVAITYVHEQGRAARDIVNLNFEAVGTKAALGGSWKCNIRPTGNKNRLNMSIEFQIQSFGVIGIRICGKVYGKRERAYKSGFPLKSAVYDFRGQPGDPNAIASQRTYHFIK
eukprot:TRINITY_DN707_c0_g1_i2.p1 TRINITY_DN707_c0_g1~~TRINITY_DN707_c0_g1_i2.p1  ORF type:complete len:271 (-),score=2.56 TRINITY_DN707_c0_g1_i2:412-1128(-)